MASELFTSAFRVVNWIIKRLISVLSVIVIRYVVFKAVLSVVDYMMWGIGEEENLYNGVSETYLFT